MPGQIIDDQNLYDIANAIRRINGTSILYRPQDMDNAILDLPDPYTIYKLDSIVDGSITNYYNSEITSIDTYGFAGYTNLISIDLPNVTTISYYGFINCTSLTNINLPSVTTIENDAFESCTSLTTINLPAIQSMGGSVFLNCTSLTSVILPGSTVCTNRGYTFNNTPIASGTGYIYVPSNLVSTYKSATGWSTYANQIRAIS